VIRPLVLAALLLAVPAFAAQKSPAPPPPPIGATTAPNPPAPLAPPTGIAPAPTAPTTLSPILTQPGPLVAAPTVPPPGSLPPPVPGPIDQQKVQTYRSDLEQQRRALEYEGVSPADPRVREIQQQLDQLR
jgi:hypothetical protein